MEGPKRYWLQVYPTMSSLLIVGLDLYSLGSGTAVMDNSYINERMELVEEGARKGLGYGTHHECRNFSPWSTDGQGGEDTEPGLS